MASGPIAFGTEFYLSPSRDEKLMKDAFGLFVVR
jgi:hypothetical protein